MLKVAAFVVLMLASGLASATNSHHNQPKTTTVKQSQSQDQHQKQSQGQSQTAEGGTGIGVGVGYGGAGGEGGRGGKGGDAESNSDSSSTSESDASANNEGNSLSVTNEAVRQTPSAMAPDVFPTAVCQGGISAGASAPGFGVSFGKSYSVTESCLFVLAQNYMALGLTQAACEVLNTTQSAKKAGVVADCKPAAPVNVVTKEELREHEKRIVEKLTSK